MSQTLPPSAYQSIFDKALSDYMKTTQKDLCWDSLLRQLESCQSSPDAVLDIFRQLIPKSGEKDNWLTKWLNPTVKVLSSLSGTVGRAVALAYPPGAVIFTAIGVLLSAVQGVDDSRVALGQIFDRIERFFERLQIYLEAGPATGMADILAGVMVAVLSILALVTKEINRNVAKKFLKSLLGNTDIKDALVGLESLLQDESRMAGAQSLKFIFDVKHYVEQIANDFNDLKRDKSKEDIKKWLSPTNSSMNRITARKDPHPGTTAWLTRDSSTFKDWKASGSLLWIHGKSGSGKSFLTSAIIQTIKDDITIMNANIIDNKKSITPPECVAYFFFDVNEKKQDAYYALLISLLVQLSEQYNSFSDILSRHHGTHRNGSEPPKESVLISCLEEMLRIPWKFYLIIDALDECPDDTGVVSPRRQVLNHVERLVNSKTANLRLCVTSCFEPDIKAYHAPITSISLGDEYGQKRDIEQYIESIIYSDDWRKLGWTDGEKTLVVNELSQNAGGMFRWVSCQLETLRLCPREDLESRLKELPKSLNETYERILKGIPEPQQQRANKILQCLTVATRPLRVVELAQVLTVKIPGGGHLPTVEEDVRWEGEEHDVLTACSSLIDIANVDNSRLVQFSHSSVREFLSHRRLEPSNGDSSQYIDLERAHTTMAQACLGVLCQLDYKTDNTRIKTNSPLVEYAAQNWVSHANFGNVLSHIEHGVDYILDKDRPHLAAWLWVRNRSQDTSGQSRSEDHPKRLEATPLYHVAELGFTRLVEYLLSKHPEDVTTKGGQYGTPLHAAVHERHIEVVKLLAKKNVNVRGPNDQTPLHAASRLGYYEIGRQLIDEGAEVNACDNKQRTSLHLAAAKGRREVIPILLEKADVTIRDEQGKMPLHAALDGDSPEAAELLLIHGADADAQVDTNQGQTPLQHAAKNGRLNVMKLLLKHHADVDVRDTTKNCRTLLHDAVWNGNDDVMQLLLDHGADVNAKDGMHTTPLHLATYRRNLKAVQLLLENGANVHLRDREGENALGVVSKRRHPKIMRILTEYMRT